MRKQIIERHQNLANCIAAEIPATHSKITFSHWVFGSVIEKSLEVEEELDIGIPFNSVNHTVCATKKKKTDLTDKLCALFARKKHQERAGIYGNKRGNDIRRKQKRSQANFVGLMREVRPLSGVGVDWRHSPLLFSSTHLRSSIHPAYVDLGKNKAWYLSNQTISKTTKPLAPIRLFFSSFMRKPMLPRMSIKPPMIW